MEVRIEKIGPERAEHLLSTQRNRNLSRTHLSKLARDMESGAWRPNSVIRVANTPDGERLIDGQHRLRAIILTGLSQVFVVIYGLDLDDQEVVDTGRARTLADSLTIRGETNATVLASAIGWFWRRQNGMPTSNGSPTITEGFGILRDHPTLRLSIPPTRAVSRLLKIPAGLSCCLHYQMTLLDPESADEFWAKLTSPSDLGGRHPILVLRQRLEKNAFSTIAKLDYPVIHAFIIKTWNAYMAGAEVAIIKWVRGGANAEPFPEMRGPDAGDVDDA